MTKYKLTKIEDEFVGGNAGFKFYKTNDSSNDYNRVLETLNKGCMIISACRSRFGRSTDVEFNLTKDDIKKQLDSVGASYTDNQIDEYMEDIRKYPQDEHPTLELNKVYNFYATQKLKEDVNKLNFGYRPVWGLYQETGVISGDKETSFLIPYIPEKIGEEDFAKLAVELCDKYYQDAVLLTLPWMERAVFITKDYDIDAILKQKPRIANEEDMYLSQTKRTNSKPFTFEFDDMAKIISDSIIKIKSQFEKDAYKFDKGWRRVKN